MGQRASLPAPSPTIQSPGGLGGGISNHGLLTIDADTFTANVTSAAIGGGIYSISTQPVNITNSTFSGNFGGMAGGGLLVNGPANILNAAFFGNTPDGISSPTLNRSP